MPPRELMISDNIVRRLVCFYILLAKIPKYGENQWMKSNTI